MKKKSLSAKKKIHKKLLNYLKYPLINRIYKNYSNYIKFNLKKSTFSTAVSGGSDSLALAYLSKCYSILNNVKVNFYHIDHKLRKESSLEAKKLNFLLKKFDINCKILKWNGQKPKSNIQAIARKKRYSLIYKECIKDKSDFILTAHHLDDLYENFIIRLLRGSGLKGLVSFYNYRNLQRNNINIVRPLLDFSKEDLFYITKNTFNFYIDDPSNRSLEYLRSRVRFMITNLKKNGLDEKKFKMTFENLISSNNSIEYFVQKNISENSSVSLLKKNNGKAFLSLEFFSNTDEIILRSFTKILQDISGRYFPARGKGVSRIINQIKQKSLTKTTIGGCVIEKIENSVVISKENTK